MLTLQNYVGNVQRNLCRSSLSSALLQMANLQRTGGSQFAATAPDPGAKIGARRDLAAELPVRWLFSPGIGDSLMTRKERFPTTPYLGSLRSPALQRLGDDQTGCPRSGAHSTSRENGEGDRKSGV